ncbi:MAG: lincosamide nucleotidyltransferase Lnu(F) [Roseiflexaceae bacterium]
MLLQLQMIERTRSLCQQDARMVAAIQYGSFTVGEADEFSDIEFAFFFADDALPTIDQPTWVAQIAPVALYFLDDVGHHTAIFTNLIRAEFHFEPASAILTIAQWQGNAWFPSYESAILLDRTGALASALKDLIGPPPTRDTPTIAMQRIVNFANWMVFGRNVFARGELARALDILSLAHRNLLWLVRLVEQTTDHWPTPSKHLEYDLSAQAYQRYQGCTAPLEREQLGHAYAATWQWGSELSAILAARHALILPTTLLDQITQQFTARSM